MSIIVLNLLEGTSINDALISFEAGAIFTLIRNNGHGSKLNSLDRLPRLFRPTCNADTIEASRLKGFEEFILTESPRQTTGP
jgi:hypothetical protein